MIIMLRCFSFSHLRQLIALELTAVVISLLLISYSYAEELTVHSPNGELIARVNQETETPSVQVFHGSERAVVISTIGLELTPATEGGWEITEEFKFCSNTEWTPLWGENDTIRDAYRAVLLTLRERGPLSRVIQFEIRVYNEGVAFRYITTRSNNDWKIVGESTELSFEPSSDCWPLRWTEATYPQVPERLSEVRSNIYPPLTLRLPSGLFLSTFEGSGDDYPRMLLNSLGDGVLQFKLLGEANLSGDFKSCGLWRVISIGSDEGELIANEPFLYNLSKPSQFQDSSWVSVGKTLSNEGNCNIDTKKLKSMVDFACACGMKYIQIDWGWYGTEWKWTKEEQDLWAQTNPDKADDLDWRRNCEANPYFVAKGLVPYLPTWKSSTIVNLDLPELIRYAREKGIGICLYVNDKVLKSNDLEKLFAEYERWGLVGLKPGFVAYGSQENERAIKDMIAIAARNRLWLCVHDSYLPNGYSRTYPNLFSVEGGGGQEGNHPAYHDVTLPFGRCLAGPFDYTPYFYCQGKSHAHQASLLMTIYNPAPVIRGGWTIRDAQKEGGYGAAFGTELEFIRRVPTDWKKTRVLEAKIGKYLAIARQAKDGVWYLGATSGEDEASLKLPLDFLTVGKRYRISLWRDADEEREGWRPTVLEQREVGADSKLKVILRPRGGAVAIFDEIEE